MTEKETDPEAINKDQSMAFNTTADLINKCEQIMVVDKTSAFSENSLTHHSAKEEENAEIVQIESKTVNSDESMKSNSAGDCKYEQIMATDENTNASQKEEKITEISIADNNEKSTNSNTSQDFINKCEQALIVAENSTGSENTPLPKPEENTEIGNLESRQTCSLKDFSPIEEFSTDDTAASHSIVNVGDNKQEEETEIGNLDSQQTCSVKEASHIEDFSTDVVSASHSFDTAGDNKEVVDKTGIKSEDVGSVIDDFASIRGLPSQLEEEVIPNLTSEYTNTTEQNELMTQTETCDTEFKHVLLGNSCQEQELMKTTELSIAENIAYEGQTETQQTVREKNDESVLEIQSDTQPVSIISNNTTEMVLESVPNAVCSIPHITTDTALQKCNTGVVKSTSAKSTSSVLKAKPTPALSSSKKMTATETAKKPVGGVAKPKVPAVKPTTMSVTSDRKMNKTTPVSAPITRKPAVTTTAAPKNTLKAPATARSIQTTSAAKTTTSRPVPASRTINSSLTTARKPALSVTSSTAKTRPASTSTVPAKPTASTALGNSNNKPKATSPRATLTSQMRKPGPTTTTAKSPVKIANSITKPSLTSLGTRPKPAISTASTVGSTSMKTTAARVAPKVSSCSTTTSRRSTLGGSTSGSTPINTATKVTAARKSSPIKPASGKTPTKPVASKTNAVTKSAIKITSPKPTENKLKEQSEMNGGITLNKTNDLNVTNGGSQDPSTTGGHQQSLIDNEDLNKPYTNDTDISTSEDFKHGVIDPLQEDMIGAFDH